METISSDTSLESAPTIHIRSEHPEGGWAVRVLRRNARRFMAALGAEGELSILVGSDDLIQEANREWREQNRPTDVLAFPAGGDFDDVPLEEGPKLLGDVLISLDTARRQAREKSHPLSVELARLLAHGLLHLLGYDHETPEDAREMALAEIELLGSVGLVAQAMELSPEQLEIVKPHRLRSSD